MARARGFEAQMALKTEVSYGVAPSGNYIKLPFITTDIGAEQPLGEAPEIGVGRDPQEPWRDVITEGGQVEVPVDLRNFGNWLRLLLGPPVTDEGSSGQFLHTFNSGVVGLPSVSIEVGHPAVPAFLMNKGIRANSMSFNFQRSGPAQVAMELIGQAESRAVTSQAGTVTEAVFSRFNQFQGSLKKDSVAIANITGATMVYNNNLEPIPVIRPDGVIENVEETLSACTGTLDVRFADTVLLALAESGGAMELEFAYIIDGDRQLIWTLHEVRIPKPKQSVSGPGGVSASFDFHSSTDPVLKRMATVELYNDVPSYA